MNTMIQYKILLLLCCSLFCFSSITHAQDEEQSAEQTGEQVEEVTGLADETASEVKVPEWIRKPVFQYRSEGKPDPFSSFLKAKAARQQQKVKKTNRALSPLEQLEVTQLKVVGIVWNEDNPDKAVAMVELPSGKGFVLKKGTRVGMNRGRVVSITKEQVHVLEETEDILGDVVTRAIVLKLHAPQGEKQ